jgi:hypothetical protein
MPWVTRRSLEELKRWEPEPFPQLGLTATMMAFGAEEWLLDRYRGGVPAKAVGWLCDQLDPRYSSYKFIKFNYLKRTSPANIDSSNGPSSGQFSCANVYTADSILQQREAQ